MRHPRLLLPILAIVSVAIGLGLALDSAPVHAKDDAVKRSPLAGAKVDFNKDVEPILAKHCYSCHGPQKQKSDLRLDRKAAAIKGGAEGPAIVPGRRCQ